jgi:hypothetical protein
MLAIFTGFNFFSDHECLYMVRNFLQKYRRKCSSHYPQSFLLSKRFGLSMKEMIETFALSEDMAVTETLKIDSFEWDEYFLKKYGPGLK